MQCSSVPAGKTTGLSSSSVLDYSAIGDETEIADGEITWLITPLVTVPDVPDAPVTSVNGKTGAVTITPANIGALARSGGRLAGSICTTTRYPVLLEEASATTLQVMTFVAARANEIGTGGEHQRNAKLDLYHKDTSVYGDTYSGAFNLQAGNTSGKSELFGRPDGTLTWRNRNIVRSVNGIYADVEGNVNLQNNPGEIIAFAGNGNPNGRFLLCNGSAISRTTYKELYAAIGTIYGDGDGATTFNLPNFDGRFLEGSTVAGMAKEAGLPNITGASTGVYATETPAGAFAYESDITMGTGSGSNYKRGQVETFDASRCSGVYGKSDTVQPNSMTVRFFIKY
jgi:hypothetical protein